MTATPRVGSTFFGLDISQLGQMLFAFRRRLSKRVLLIEFCLDALHLAEATITEEGVGLSHLSRIDLPAEAFERGVPASPETMARLIQDFCAEKKIPAHRVAVVIPPEVAFHRSVELPARLSIEEARIFVLDPANGVQLPFPLIQTDFDLFPLTTLSISQQLVDSQHYMIAAVPQVLVDRVVETVELADFELQLLELGSHSLLRGMATEILMLDPREVILVLELLPECSNLLQISCSGLFASERLSSIRDFPRPELDDDAMRLALEQGQSAENMSIKDQNYFPLSDLDLRALIAEIKAFLRSFHQRLPGATIRCMRLMGINSAHPLLVDLLSNALDFPVEVCRPLLARGIAGFKADDLLVQSNLGRLAGLALGLLSNDQLMSCPMAATLSRTDPSNEGLLKGVPDHQEVNAADELNPVPLMVAAPQSDVTLQPVLEDVEVVDEVDAIQKEEPLPSVVDVVEVEMVEANQVEKLKLEKKGDMEESWPSIGGLEEEDVVKELKLEKEGDTEERWPSIGGLEEEDVVKELKLEKEGDTEESWPSIGGLEEEEAVKELKLEKEGDTEESWLSIGGMEEEEAVKELKLEKEGDMEESWPSIGSLEEEDVVEELNAEDLQLQGEPSAQNLEQQNDQTSLLVIPGLEHVVPVDNDKPSKSDLVVPNEQADNEAESLGVLRFADSE